MWRYILSFYPLYSVPAVYNMNCLEVLRVFQHPVPASISIRRYIEQSFLTCFIMQQNMHIILWLYI